MAGAGIEVQYDEAAFQGIIDALSKASMPDLKKIADFAGAELDYISKKAFEKEKDPVTNEPWQELKHPRIKKGKGKKGTTKEWHPILVAGGQLKRSMTWEAFPDGSVIFGSNMVYARIHQQGGEAGRGHASLIPARPYMGVPQDFDRRILNDPEVLKLLGLAE
jgi:phage virion morphogenesis protein